MKLDTFSIRPSWASAPEWATHLAMDSDGMWFWHGDKPEMINRSTEEGSFYWHSRHFCEAIPEEVEWTDTLESRP